MVNFRTRLLSLADRFQHILKAFITTTQSFLEHSEILFPRVKIVLNGAGDFVTVGPRRLRL